MNVQCSRRFGDKNTAISEVWEVTISTTDHEE